MFSDDTKAPLASWSHRNSLILALATSGPRRWSALSLTTWPDLVPGPPGACLPAAGLANPSALSLQPLPHFTTPRPWLSCVCVCAHTCACVCVGRAYPCPPVMCVYECVYVCVLGGVLLPQLWCVYMSVCVCVWQKHFLRSQTPGSVGGGLRAISGSGVWLRGALLSRMA